MTTWRKFQDWIRQRLGYAPLVSCKADDAVITTFTCPDCGKARKLRISQCNETAVACGGCGKKSLVFAAEDGMGAKVIISRKAK